MTIIKSLKVHHGAELSHSSSLFLMDPGLCSLCVTVTWLCHDSLGTKATVFPQLQTKSYKIQATRMWCGVKCFLSSSHVFTRFCLASCLGQIHLSPAVPTAVSQWIWIKHWIMKHLVLPWVSSGRGSGSKDSVSSTTELTGGMILFSSARCLTRQQPHVPCNMTPACLSLVTTVTCDELHSRRVSIRLYNTDLWSEVEP